MHDSVRGGLLFVQPRSKIDRDISYQPVPALGYYWRSGIHGHPTWNAISPSFGFTMALLDFSDSNSTEIGFAGGISIFRDLAWVGYFGSDMPGRRESGEGGKGEGAELRAEPGAAADRPRD